MSNHECFACGAKFDIKFDEEEMELNFCPSCGQETIDELNLSEANQEVLDFFEEDLDENY